MTQPRWQRRASQYHVRDFVWMHCVPRHVLKSLRKDKNNRVGLNAPSGYALPGLRPRQPAIATPKRRHRELRVPVPTDQRARREVRLAMASAGCCTLAPRVAPAQSNQSQRSGSMACFARADRRQPTCATGRPRSAVRPRFATADPEAQPWQAFAQQNRRALFGTRGCRANLVRVRAGPYSEPPMAMPQQPQLDPPACQPRVWPALGCGAGRPRTRQACDALARHPPVGILGPRGLWHALRGAPG